MGDLDQLFLGIPIKEIATGEEDKKEFCQLELLNGVIIRFPLTPEVFIGLPTMQGEEDPSPLVAN